MPLDEINDAFDLMHAGESIRSVVTVTEPGAQRKVDSATSQMRPS